MCLVPDYTPCVSCRVFFVSWLTSVVTRVCFEFVLAIVRSSFRGFGCEPIISVCNLGVYAFLVDSLLRRSIPRSGSSSDRCQVNINTSCTWCFFDLCMIGVQALLPRHAFWVQGSGYSIFTVCLGEHCILMLRDVGRRGRSSLWTLVLRRGSAKDFFFDASCDIGGRP